MGTQNQNGSSLIEVMVALFVLAIGLLGMLAMQTKSMQYNQAAYSYSQAAYLAADMAERIRSNPSVADTYIMEKNGTSSDAVDCSGGCTATQIKNRDQGDWINNIVAYLPAGTGSVTRLEAPVDSDSDSAGGEGEGEVILEPIEFLHIEVGFTDDRVAAIDGEGAQTYSLVVEI